MFSGSNNYNMKTFLSLTALLEGSTGMALIVAPQFIVPLLLSTPLEEPAGIFSTRIAGIAITFLALNCWFSRSDKYSSGIMNSLFFYNSAIIAIFIYAGIAYSLTGIILWLVVVAHAGLGLWGVILMRKNRALLRT